MIPPITDVLIAEATQTSGMMAAGQAYWLNGRVRGLEIDPAMALIVAEVQGSARDPYEVTIAFSDDGADPPEPFVECTCPVGFDCKHGAAVLFAAQEQIGSGLKSGKPRADGLTAASARPVQLPPSLQQWLAEAQSEAIASQRGGFEAVYVFTSRVLHDGKSKKGKSLPVISPATGISPAHRLTVAVWLWGEDTRTYGAARWFQPSPYELQQRLVLGETDRWLVRRMAQYGGDFDGTGSPKGVAGGDWIDKLIATGRARWRKPDGQALHWGEDQPANWQWVTLPDGGQQRLMLGGIGEGQILLATAPPLVVDETTGCVHRVACNTDSAQAQRLLMMPPIPPAAVPQIAQQWPAIASPGIPAPALAQIVERGVIQPVPVLTFLQEKVETYLPRRYASYSSYSSHTQKSEMALARLTFDYGGYRVIPTEHASTIITHTEGDFSRFTRDIASESAALDEMLDQGLIPLEVFEEIKAKSAQLWDFAPCQPASATDFATFLQAAVPRLRQAGWQIEYSPKWKLTIAEVAGDDLQFNVTPSGTDWFDVALGARIDGKVVDILPVLRRMLAQGGPEWLEQAGESIAIPIGPGKLAQLPTEQIRPVLAMLLAMALDERDASGPLHLPRSDIAVLAELETASVGQIGWSGGDALRQLARALTRIETETTVTPPSFTATLRPYQQQGLDWLQALHSTGFGGVLADDMGLGKTVQTLAHIATLKHAGTLDAPVLIVCPTSVLPNWQAEIARFTPDLNAAFWHGSNRQGQQDMLASADVILTSYPVLLRDHALFAKQDLALILFDEAHVLKNPKTAGFKAAKTLKAGQIIALSGTPVENQLTDLWSLMELVTPNLLGPLDQFKRTIDRPIVRDDDAAAKALLRRRLRPFMLRRTKDEVARDLPAKTDIPEWIDLGKAQLASYESLRLLMQKRVRDEIARVGLLRSQIVFLDALLKLRQLCCDPRLVPQYEGKAESAKLARLLEMLPELLREGRRIILFSQFTSMLDLIKPELDSLAICYVEIRGETRDRETPVRQFQAGEVPVILVSLKAGGTGLNLTAADTVILYDPWWNPAVEAQAIDRAHRIGQAKPVFVHRLIARGTIEEKILSLQDKKRALAAMLWEGESATPAKLSEDDVAFLLG